jgi:biofilm PGA synthesis N-glycosyltransferase PgaC
MSPFIYLTISILLIYSLLILLYLIGWIGLENYLPGKTKADGLISVVVAYRNEEKHIALLLNDLSRQHYPVQHFEIIAVNDHSEDNSPELVENFRQSSKINIIHLNLPEQLSGKKNAIKHGIELSKGRLILTTDADCRVPENWIDTFAKFYHYKKKPKLIIGLVDFRHFSGFLNCLQNLEFLSLMASGAGAAGIRLPTYCNSANLMFDRNTYNAIKDPLKTSIVSGDDTFLLHQVKRMHPNHIFVLKSTDALVKTELAANLKEFLNQRVRWISKGKHYADVHTITASAIVLLANVTVLISMIAAIADASVLMLLPLIFKMIIDWIFMTPVLSFFKKRKLHGMIPLLSILYPVYVVFVTTAGLVGGFTWKGRHY